jgi:hypothetical protein
MKILNLYAGIGGRILDEVDRLRRGVVAGNIFADDVAFLGCC